MQRTPLYETHKKLGARMTEFGGWEMPVQYKGIRAEHQAVRNQVGLFDISHMGEIIVRGPDAKSAVQYLTCNDLNRLEAGKCQYSALLTPEGTFVDDIIIYPLANDHIFICVNAGNTDKDFDWIQSRTVGSVTIRNESADWCQLAVQGPKAEAVLHNLFGETVTSLGRFAFTFVNLQSHQVLVSRTGYTGEDGFEIYGPAAVATDLWDQLMDAGKDHDLMPCGLGARDTLRLEVNYPLYGHEISDQTHPFEAGLAWIVKLNGDDFIGKAALEVIKKEGWQRQLVGINMEDRGIPRQGYALYDADRRVGEVVSGTLSPSLGTAIGTAYVARSTVDKCDKIAVDIRGKKRKAAIVEVPFYKKRPAS